MEFKYEKKFENNEKWYTLGIVRGLIKDEEICAVEVMDPAGKELCDPDEWKVGSVAVAVFGITEEEYNLFLQNREAFDELIEKLKRDIPKDRLFAEKNCVRKKDRCETIDKNNEFKKYISGKIKKSVPGDIKTPAEVIYEVLGASKICVAYSSETEKPLLNVINDKANLLLTVNEEDMDKFVKTQKNVYKKVFLGDVINSENEESIFSYFYDTGINMMGFLLPDMRVLNFPMQAVLNSPEFKGKKREGVSNPELDRSITCFYQLVRTTSPEDKNKEAFNKNMSFLDIKIMEEVLNSKFLLAQRVKKSEDGKVEFELPVVRQNETGENLIPVATCDREYFSHNEGFEKVVINYSNLCDVIKQNGLSGFVMNVKSKCSYKINNQKIEQIEKFRVWREEQIKKIKEKEQ